MEERWKDIQGYEGLYKISDHGRVIALSREWDQRHWVGGTSHCHLDEHMVKAQFWSGRAFVNLSKNKIQRKYQVSRLVAKAFIPNPNNYPIVNHLDANPLNNHFSNLEWCTQSRNIQYAYDNGTKIPPHMRKVAQYDMDGNLLKIWDSIAEAERATNAYNIRKVCTGKRNHAGGYKWQYV